jgi:ParB family chromosome partitioning protein
MALGRGLSELLGEVETAYDNSTSKTKQGSVSLIDIDLIKVNPNQPRKIFDETKLQELADSIKEYGLLQAVSVIEDNNGGYILIAGERRVRATKLNGQKQIEAHIIDAQEHKLRELALIENIQRDDLNIIELAYSYAHLINEHSLTHEELSKRIFKSRTSITNTLRLLSLSVYVQQLLGSDKISAGHAKVLIGLDDKTQKMVVDSIIGQKLSVRETEQLVKDIKNENKNQNSKKTIKKLANIDFKPLDLLITNLKSSKLKVKAQKNYLKIEFNSQDDINKLLEHLKLS